MSCTDCGKNYGPGPGDPAGTVKNESYIFGDTVEVKEGPKRPNAIRTILEGDNERAKKLGLSRGSYKVFTEIEYQGDQPAFIQDQEKALDIDGELKRVFYHKIEVKNIRQLDEFTKKADAIMEFTVIDNVLPLAPIIWGGSIVASGVTGYFFVNKVQEFTETTAGGFLSAAAAIAGLLVAWKVLRG